MRKYFELKGMQNWLFIAALNFILLLLSMESGFSQDANRFKINPDNPHYFLYKNQPIFLVASGGSEDIRYSKNSLTSFKENHARLKIWLYDCNGNGSPDRPYRGDNIKSGFNEEYWNSLRSHVDWAFQNDVIVGITVFMTTVLETDSPGRWGGHAWNAKWGGPIDIASNGKDSFYSLDDYNNSVSGPYNDSWAWQKKNQYRQQELIDKVLTTFDYPNVYLMLMWEIHDTEGSSNQKAQNWWRTMARYVKEKDSGMLLTVAEASGSNALYGGGLIDQWVFDLSGLDFMTFQNRPVFENDLRQVYDAYWSLNKPFTNIGTRWEWHADQGHNYTNSEIEAIKRSMRDMFLYGMQPGANFGGHIFQDGSAKNEIHSYAKKLAEFANTVETWCDEPGQEVTIQTLPSLSDGNSVDLPPSGSCDDVVISDPPPAAPGGVKVSTN